VSEWSLPGIVVFLTSWYRPDEIAVGSISAPGQFRGISNALIRWVTSLHRFPYTADVLSYSLSYIPVTNKVLGWKILFIIEGCTGMLHVVFLYFFLPNNPDAARFLSSDERSFIESRLPPKPSADLTTRSAGTRPSLP
jgi:hypothetical protein